MEKVENFDEAIRSCDILSLHMPLTKETKNILNYDKITYHREVMGLGDVKYMAMIGVFIGWKGVLFTLFTASIIGTVVSLPSRILRSDNALNRIPFGPFLSLGAITWLFYGPQLLDWYLNLIRMGNP